MPAADGAGSERKQKGQSCFCGAKQTAKHKAYQLYTCSNFVDCMLEKYSKIHWVGEYIVVGESKATWTGLHSPPPYLEKKKVCKHQAYAKQSIMST